mmetsp:Transcript_9987/g.26486  ORF Transcript_9987/g.26486 Transcript_9987/m.26486 type:complete len:680 (-) Transcript_9987:78-2117(-)
MAAPLEGVGSNDAAKAPFKRVYPGASPFAMQSVDDCISAVLAEVHEPLRSEPRPLDDALGFVLAQDVLAPAPVPPFPASIMDGFAVRAADGSGLFCVDSVQGSTAGGLPQGPLPEGLVRYITTGAPLPEGADAVVKVEDTVEERLEDGQLAIRINVASKPGANIRQVGSDTAQGEVVLRRGFHVGAGELGVLAALGFATVEVHARPHVALLSTGDELVDVGDSAARDERRGQVVDCNRPMLRALVKECGGEVVDLGIVKDEPDALRALMTKALASADVLVTSGGVSRGSKDHMKQLLSELGTVHFGEMCMKPGKPTTFATVPMAKGQRRLVFALPGNPVSCFVTFKLMVAPAILKLCGWPPGSPLYPRVDAELAQDVEMDPVRPEYHRALARWEGGRFIAQSTGFQRSSRVASVANANCFLEIPKRSGVLPRGTVVKALLLPSGALPSKGEGYPYLAPRAPEVLHNDAGEGALGSAHGISGCPRPVPDSGVAAPAAGSVASAHATQQPQAPLQCHVALPHRVGVVVVGAEGDRALPEVLACLRAALRPREGTPPSDSPPLPRQLVVAGQVAEVQDLVASLSGSDASDASLACDVVLVLGSFGLRPQDAVAIAAVRALLHQEAPGICDAVLRAGMARTQLVMLSELVAGRRNRSLVLTVPVEAPMEAIQAVLPLWEHVMS